jgi:hypothetical protein
VVVIMNKQASRNHVVDVRASAETVVEIDPKLDQSVRTVGFTGFLFPNQTEREVHEAPYAAKFAKATGASACAVIGIDDVKGRASVVGTLISLQTGRELRRASIPIEPDPSNDKLRALARFLAGEEAAPGLDVQFANPAERLIGKHHGGESGGGGVDEHHGPWGGWRFLTAGAAVGAFVVGGVYLYLDKRCREEPPAGQTCSKVYDTAKWGYIGLGGGAVLAGISIYLFATYDKAPVLAPTQGGATVGFATRF